MGKAIHSYNKEFFKKIDTEEKAYFYGLLMADGNVSSKRDYFQISLQEEDKYILEKFIYCLESNYHLYVDREKYYSLKVTGKEIVEDLINNGLVPQKTHILLPPVDKVPKELIHHLIRGYFDGDGCIWYDEGAKSYAIQFVGTKEVLEFFKDFLHIKQKLRKTEHSENIYRLSSRGNINVDEIGEILYKDATLYLTRKKEKFDKCFARPNKRKRRK